MHSSHLHPKFSIITVTYNAEAVLDDTIQSVVAQTYKEIEYIAMHPEVIPNYEAVGVTIELNPYNLQDGMRLFKQWLNLLRRNKR